MFWYQVKRRAVRAALTYNNSVRTLPIRRSNRPVRYVALAAAGLLLLAALGFVAYSLLVAAGVISPDKGMFAGQCRPTWRLVEAAQPSPVYNELHGMDIFSPTLSWAVGTYGEEDFALPLIERWDGTAWTAADTPSVPDYSNHLYAVAALSTTDAWAVGASHRGTDIWRTMALHWDGKAWSIVPTPTIAPVSSLNAVAGAASDDLWAVGETSTGSKGTGSSALAMRWDGSEWTLVDTGIRLTNAVLNGVTALSPDDVWAVGSYTDASGTVYLPLAIHWDGVRWTQTEVPGEGQLWSVSAASSGEVWAVGNFGPQSLALRWDGEAWSRVPSPNPGASNVLYSVAASPEGAWAAGARSKEGHDVPFVARWTGEEWQETPAPAAGSLSDTLWGIDVIGGEGWAVGASIRDALGNNAPITLRLDNPCAE